MCFVSDANVNQLATVVNSGIDLFFRLTSFAWTITKSIQDLKGSSDKMPLTSLHSGNSIPEFLIKWLNSHEPARLHSR